MNKKSLRKIALEKRAQINLPDAAKKIAANFFDKIELPQNSIIASYMSHKGEIDVQHLCAKLEAQEHFLCLPRIDFVLKKMVFCAYKIGEELTQNAYGIWEPKLGAPELVPNVVLIPMLGFDRTKNRLGYGGGYYDKVLQNSTALKVGIAYSTQEIEQIPVELHDIKMDKIVTEDFVL